MIQCLLVDIPQNCWNIHCIFWTGKSHHTVTEWEFPFIMNILYSADICLHININSILFIPKWDSLAWIHFSLRNWMQTMLHLTRFNFVVVVYSIKLRLLSRRKQKSILPAVCHTEIKGKTRIIPSDLSDATNEQHGNEEIWKFIFNFICLHFTKRSLDRMTEYYHFSLRHLSDASFHRVLPSIHLVFNMNFGWFFNPPKKTVSS